MRKTPAPGRAKGHERGPVTPLAIVEAAIAVTAREGLEAASLRRVAEEARTSKSSILHHFGSATGLRRSMVTRLGQRYQELTVKAAAGHPGDVETRGPKVLDAVFQAHNREFFLAVHELASAAARDPVMAEEARTTFERAIWMIAVLLGPPIETALPTAQAIFAATQGFIDLWMASGTVDPRPYRDAAERAAAAVLRARGSLYRPAS